jgi:hypothetical protein
MIKIMKALVIAGVLSAGSLAAAPAASAYPHRSGVSIYFNTGNVAFGYRDGYYDRYHRWHRWHRNYDRDYYRDHYRSHYYDRYDNRRYHRW